MIHDHAGTTKNARTFRGPEVALIDEKLCIGCTLCIAACPVDAIVGAAHLMHTVIARDCIGCELCLPPCPVDCIRMIARDLPFDAAHKKRLTERARQRRRRMSQLERAIPLGVEEKTVVRALERARQRLAQRVKR